LLSSVLLLTGCSALGGSVEELLVAPSLSKDQTRALECVKQNVGTAINLSYPKEGEHKNPIIFFDLTGDGVDEAIVFYTKKDEVNVNFSICQKLGGSYRVVYQSEGVGNQIVEVRFAHVTHLSYYNMLITWNAYNQNTSFFSLYGFENTRISELLTKEGQEALVSDLDGDLFDELVMISRVDADGVSNLEIYKQNRTSGIRRLCSAGLDVDMLQYRSITLQKDKTRCTLFIDGMLKDNLLATQVFRYESGNLKPLMARSDGSIGLIGSSVRGGSMIYCSDVYEDGIVDVPTSVSKGSDGFDYVAWSHFDESDSFVYTATTFECPEMSLRFAMTSEMLREASFAINTEMQQLTMLNKDGDVELLITVVEPDESASTYYTNGYSLLAEKGLDTYVFMIEEAGTQAGLNEQIVRNSVSVT